MKVEVKQPPRSRACHNRRPLDVTAVTRRRETGSAGAMQGPAQAHSAGLRADVVFML
jgi:hypothetical protein